MSDCRTHTGHAQTILTRLTRLTLLTTCRPAERAAIVRSRRLPVVALHLAAQTVQRMVRGHQVRLLVSYATSNEPALRHRAPEACRAAAVAAAERLKQRRPRVPKAARAEGAGAPPAEEGQLDESEVGLISRYLEAKMRRSEDALQLTFNDWVLQRLQAWRRQAGGDNVRKDHAYCALSRERHDP